MDALRLKADAIKGTLSQISKKTNVFLALATG